MAAGLAAIAAPEPELEPLVLRSRQYGLRVRTFLASSIDMPVVGQVVHATKAKPYWSRVVRRLTGGPGANRIVDVGGPSTLAQSIASVGCRGQVSLVGALGAGAPVDFFRLFLSQADYRPIGVGSRSDTEAMLRALAAGGVKPIVDRAFGFAEAKAAWGYYSERGVFGKVVVRHGG